MKEKKIKSSTLLSLFRRKGGEGAFTKIVTNDNSGLFVNQLRLLKENEIALVCYKQDEFNWVLITNTRILKSSSDVELSIQYNEIKKVYPDLENEFKDNKKNKISFTYLIIEDGKNKYSIKVEKGEPFQGMYQMLHFIASKK